MKYSFGVLNTDQVNRQNICIPVGVLFDSIVKHVSQCERRGMPLGMPSHISHDMHRLIGWCETNEVHLSGFVARQLGTLFECTTADERKTLGVLRDKFWKHHNCEITEPYRESLQEKLSEHCISNSNFIATAGSAAINREGIARDMFPKYFDIESNYVDKDGMVDYRHLLSKTQEIKPGLFLDKSSGLVLYAHRFFRRSLSHKNDLNSYFLRSFSKIAQSNPDLDVRIRLDPDLLGHPESLTGVVELEYWRGPLFSDDIDAIPSGVNEHSSCADLLHYEAINKTQFWWKSPEHRAVNGEEEDYRTFEAEELIDQPSGGLDDECYGCRYVHAEYKSKSKSITHFDGAIRAYSGDKYIDRLDQSIDRAGKHSEYTKLFRFDGALVVSDWKSLSTDFFRGNWLVMEYLEGEAPSSQGEASSKTVAEHNVPKLEGLIRVDIAEPTLCSGIHHSMVMEAYGEKIPLIELGSGSVFEYLKEWVGQEGCKVIAFNDKTLNIAPIVLGMDSESGNFLIGDLAKLAECIDADHKNTNIEEVSIRIVWQDMGLQFTLSLAGHASNVANALREVALFPSFGTPTNDWVEKISKIVRGENGVDPEPVHWLHRYSKNGRLECPREGEIEFCI